MNKYVIGLMMMLTASFGFADSSANGKMEVSDYYIHDGMYVTDTTGLYVVDSRVKGIAPGWPLSVIEYELADDYIGLIPMTAQMGNGANYIETGEWISWSYTEGYYKDPDCTDDYVAPQFYEDDVVFIRREGAERTYSFYLIDRTADMISTDVYYIKLSKSCKGPLLADVLINFYYVTAILDEIPDLKFTISAH